MNYYLQGRAYYDVDQLSSAAAAFQEAVLLDSSLWQARGGLGLIFARQGDFERCVQSFRQVLEASPGNPAATQNLASCEAEIEGAG
jgi:Flp pilus assembly protein TadD